MYQGYCSTSLIYDLVHQYTCPSCQCLTQYSSILVHHVSVWLGAPVYLSIMSLFNSVHQYTCPSCQCLTQCTSIFIHHVNVWLSAPAWSFNISNKWLKAATKLSNLIFKWGQKMKINIYFCNIIHGSDVHSGLADHYTTPALQFKRIICSDCMIWVKPA